MRNKTVIFFIVLIFSVIVYTISIMRYFGATNFITLTSVLMLGTLWILGFLFLRKCLYWYTDFMFNDKTTFVKKVDRPRVYLFSLLFPVLVAIYYIIRNVNHDIIVKDASGIMQIVPFVYFSILLCLNVTFAILLFFSLSKKFELLYLPKIKKVLDHKDDGFKTKLSSPAFGEIFERMVKCGFLAYGDLKEQSEKKKLFEEIFVTGKVPKEQLFYLHMDNRQLYVFHDCLSQKLDKFELNHLVKIFRNKNTKMSAKSIVESYRSFEKKQKEKGISTVRVKNQNKIEWLFELNEI